jgi:PTH1 family peptidyl-tRNA hydrolase
VKIIVGLGNPGAKYETTRHNVGWLALDRLIDDWKASGPQIKNQAEVFQAKVNHEPVLLVKPQTFMNLSGRAVAPLVQFYKCEPSDIFVLHDEVDLKPMALRLKTGGGSGGHNGLKSLDESLGQNNYHRVRIGVGHPRQLDPEDGRRNMDTADWVLGQFTDQDLRELDPLFDRIKDAVELAIRENMTKAMNRFNTEEKVSDKKTEKK